MKFIRPPDTLGEHVATVDGGEVTRAYDNLAVPVELWADPELLARLAARDVAHLFRRVQKVTGASQAQIGTAVGLSQAQVSEVMSGRRKVISIEVYARIVTGLKISEPARTTLLLGSLQMTVPSQRTDEADADAVGEIDGVYATRVAFAAALPLDTLIGGARTVRACGLSLNLICQHFADTELLRLATTRTLKLLLLDPNGEAIAHREREEGYQAGTLSRLNELNLGVLDRIARRMPQAQADNLQVGLYDETVRFNLILVEDTCVAQPYLPAARGVDSPTMVIRRRGGGGLYNTFADIFDTLWDRRKPL